MLFMRFLLISFLRLSLLIYSGFLGGLLVKNLLCRSRSRHGLAVSIPRSGRCPGGGNDNPLQYSCQDNLMDRGAWQAGLYGAHGVTKSQTWLSNWARLNMIYSSLIWIILIQILDPFATYARMRRFERTPCILSIVKQITSPGGMHETSAWAWCTG